MSGCRIALVGLMGVGKSTVGRLLSEALGWPLFDLDLEIETRSGKTIPEIFASESEAGFRCLEYRVLKDISADPKVSHCILATGGGVVTTAAARSILYKEWNTVWLSAKPSTIALRLHHEAGNRPLLANADDPMSRLTQLLQERESFYQEVAKWTISVEGVRAETLVNQICQLGGWTNCNGSTFKA
jgi:shikimate kinase